ncbi:PAC2 family protein [Trueperella pecoris]|uniref:PAC2 family protein n=1 Tax=Trueperella pecoris TaxID=2733571 RepID=UPI001ABE9443|nr:PAC2 family protein [Trueperella pecoris]QTG76176.1 PAC2 family protein [Trueperella pecoris]
MAHFFTLDDIASGLRVRTLVINLIDPLIDAGDTAQAINATIDTLDAELIGTFDSDKLFDLRAQRPIVSYADGHIVALTMPQMRLMLVTDVHGESFLYLTGQEPDFRWCAVSEDILEIIERFGVENVFSFAAMPAPIPHTRPVDMLIRTTASAGDHPVVEGFAEHFAQLSDVFEHMAGEKSISVVNIRVRVPFYLVRGEAPFFAGALAAIKMLAARGGPTFPLGDLEQLEDSQRAAISQLRVEGSDFDQLVTKLEEDYDASEAGFVKNEETIPVIPSSDEIGDAVEQFLASHDSSPLERVHKDKPERRHFSDEFRRIGQGFRVGLGRLSREDKTQANSPEGNDGPASESTKDHEE